MAITNKYVNHLLKTEAGRDHIFKHCLDMFNHNPVNILEIGAARDLSDQARFGDGWSSIFWARYIEQYGGRLDIVDIDNQALENCKKLVHGINAKINFLNDDAYNHISDSTYDLIYLDGSDDPQEMLKQFNKIDRTQTVILCDDFNSKGSALRLAYPVFDLFYLTGSRFEMAVYNKVSN